MRLNYNSMLKRETFFLKTGRLSNRRSVLRPTRQRRRISQNTRPTLELAKPESGITSVQAEMLTPILVTDQIELAMEIPVNDVLGAIRN